MDIVISAIVGDLISRSTSLVINRYCQPKHRIEERLQRLKRVLLRIDTVIEEADGRHITDQGMLRRLAMLRQGMYRGHYLLDVFEYHHLHEKMEVSYSSSSSSNFSRAKRLRVFSSGSSNEALVLSKVNMQELQEMSDKLEDTIADIKEFVVFLGSYPRMVAQPYCTYLLLDNCMFGRQTERQGIMTFLMQESPSGSKFDVLPIVGPVRVGKSTLIEHVCREDWVQGRFLKIVFFPEKCLKDDGVINIGENINGIVKHHNYACQIKRLLVIIEIAEEIGERAWRRLKSFTTSCAPSGSKIIISSRSNKIVYLGTTQALRLDYLPAEAYWHFFKMLAFGSMDADEQPKLAAMAMEIASEQRQDFANAHIIAGLLKENFNAKFWCLVLKRIRKYKQTNLVLFDEHPNHLVHKDEPVYSWTFSKISRQFLIRSYHQLDSTEQVPMIYAQDILLGTAGKLPRGEFEALTLKSRIAPYYNYTIRCVMQASPRTVGRMKRI